MAKNIFKDHFGVGFPNPVYDTVKYSDIDLKSIGDSAIEEKVEYLTKIFDFEENRQATIEGKISQLLGQTGIVFSLAGLFMPLFFDKLLFLNLFWKVALILIFLSALGFYLWAIYKVTRTYDINMYKYATGEPDTVLNNSAKVDFQKIVIKDLIYANKINQISNNHKASNLIFSNNSFKSGNICMAILLVMLSMMIFFAKAEEPRKIQQVEIVNGDSLLNVHDEHGGECCQDKMPERLRSEITCPKCAHKSIETMPTDICLLKYTCQKCKVDLFPKEGDCCVFCSYGTHKCPSKQGI